MNLNVFFDAYPKNIIYLTILQAKELQKIIKNLSEPSVKKNQAMIYSKNPIPEYFEDICISRTNIAINNFSLVLLKNSLGVKLFSFEFVETLMKMLSKPIKNDFNEIMVLRCKINFQYYNKRKMSFEPLIGKFSI